MTRNELVLYVADQLIEFSNNYNPVVANIKAQKIIAIVERHFIDKVDTDMSKHI
jgi:hypothetical protein